MGSYPSFNPNKFAKPLTKSEYAALEGRASTGGEGGEAPAPLTDRAVNGTYPTGSTFKPITAMGALEAGVLDPNAGLGAGQCISVSTEQFCNAGHADYGPREPRRRIAGLLRHLLLRSRRAGQQPRQRDPEGGQGTRDRPARRASTCRARSPGSSPTAPGALKRTSSSSSASIAPTAPAAATWAKSALERRRQHASGRRPGRPGHLAAADGRRLLDARERLHEPRRRNSRGPASGDGDRRLQRGPGAGAELPAGAPRAPELLRSEPRDGRHSRRRQPAGRHLLSTCGRDGTRPSIRCTARRAPLSARPRKTSPGTCATWPTRAGRS